MSGLSVEQHAAGFLLVADPTSDAAVESLVGALVSAGDLLSRIATAVGDVEVFASTARAEALEARLYSLVEELADLGVAVVA